VLNRSMSFGAALLLLCLAGCGDDGTGPSGRTIVSVSVTPVNTTLSVGATTQLVATPMSDNGPVTGVAVTWSTSNSQIATVDEEGTVSGESPGTVTISAEAGGKTGSATIQVTQVTPGGMNLVFSTYLGGVQQDQVRDLTVDAAGNTYITGGTESPTFPTTAGAYDPTPNGNYDVFVTKIDPQGRLVWSTLVGGPNYDRAYAIELDALGYIYIAGRAGGGFPVTNGAFQTAFQGGPSGLYGPQDGFVCKLSPDGGSLIFCSYFGGPDDRIIRDLALDAQGNIYVGASLEFGTLPAPWFANSYHSTPAGGVDGVVAKIATNGSAVLWATFIGGSQDEAEQPSVRVDASGNVFVLTATASANAPTPNGVDRTLGGAQDLYLVKLTPDGKQLLFGTYIGGSGGEGVETHHLALDPQGNPVIGNMTGVGDLATTPGAYQPAYSGGSDAFVARISSDGSQLLAATFLGGPQNEAIEGISIDQAGNIYVTGQTASPGLPFLSGAFAGGIRDIMVVKLSPDLSQVLYGTYLGGSDDDMGRAAAVTPNGDLAIGGTTQSSNMITLRPIQATHGGILDAYVARFVHVP
jgi:hypothetical protein